MNKRPFDSFARERMWLVSWLMEKYGARKPLRGWKVLLIQHQLENHLAQAKALLELGLAPQDMFWMDIPYTSSAEIREEVIRLGVPRRNLEVHDYNLTQHYASYQHGRVSDWIAWYIKKYGLNKRLLVLDDGGYFLEAMVCFRDHFRYLAVVEQTTRGVRKIQENAAIQHYCSRVPVINVAESTPKKKLESPFIARAVCGALGDLLKGLLTRADVDPAQSRVLVLGYGDIGKAVAQELVRVYQLRKRQVAVYDPNARKRNAARRAGYVVWDRKHPGRPFDLVVGCSGYRSFNIWDYVRLSKRALLVSASSGSAEMAREDFVELADATVNGHIKVVSRQDLARRSIHSDIVLDIVDHRAMIANGGFPINFDGRLNRIPPEEIQVTVAMMLYAAIQGVRAVRTSKHGLIDLDRRFCQQLTDQYHNEAAVKHPFRTRRR